MKINYLEIAKQIIPLVGGKNNIKNIINCQTRLRINVNDIAKINKKKIEELPGSLGVNLTGHQFQIIYGTGKVVKMREAIDKAVGKKNESLDQVAKRNKENQKQQNDSFFQKFLGKFSGIFAPLILGFIGAGILSGIAGMLQSSYMEQGKWINETAHSWFSMFAILLNIWKGTFLVIVGWRTAEAFGGSGVIGAIISGLYVTAFASQFQGIFIPENGKLNFLGASIDGDNWFVRGFRASFDAKKGAWGTSYPSGSIFGVMISAGIVGLIEKNLRKIVPNQVDTVLTPTLTLITLLILNFVFIFPISGYVFTAVAFLFKNLYANPFGASMLAGIFLVTVVFGIHQGFVPIYVALVKETNVNGLFPVLAMAGAGQVGMAIALMLRAEKGGKLRKQIEGAIIPGFLGIGEPLIYGVSLPRVKPFITACIGGAIGGLFIGAYNLWAGDSIGLNTTFGPSGLLMLPLMTSVQGAIWKGVLVALGGIVISYGAGFAATYFFGYKNVDLT